MNELEMMAYLIVDEMVDTIGGRLTRAFDRLMAPEEMDSDVFAVEFCNVSVLTPALAHTARA